MKQQLEWLFVGSLKNPGEARSMFRYNLVSMVTVFVKTLTCYFSFLIHFYINEKSPLSGTSTTDSASVSAT